MGNLTLNSITPNGVGKIKLGSSNVQRIYNGSTLVWPASPGPAPAPDPEPVEICGLIWTDANSSETELIAGGNIPILTNDVDWYAAWEGNTPAACYVDFDPSNSTYGLIYNYWARYAIKPPTGFRLPTTNDWGAIFSSLSSTCYVDNGNRFNRFGANPGEWNPAQLTNTAELGDTGFNSEGYGYAYTNTTTEVLEFQNFQQAEVYWTDNSITPSTPAGYGFSLSSGEIGSINIGDYSLWCFFMRFVKDA